MSTPIYQLYVWKANNKWREMPEWEQKALNEKGQASLQATGARSIFNLFSAWANEEHPWWGVIRFPDVESRFEHTRTLREIGWLERVDAFTLLGTAEREPEPVTIPNPIYQLWIIKSNPAAEQARAALSKEETAALWDKHNAAYREVGGQVVLSCNSYWCNAAYPSFSVSVYPSFEAVQNLMQELAKIGWQKYFDASTLPSVMDP